MFGRLAFDIETNGLLPELDRIHCLEIKDVDSGQEYSFGPDEVELGIDVLEKADEIIGHNILGFDIPAIQKIYPDFKVADKQTDTLVLSQLIKGDLKNEDFTYQPAELPKRLYGSHSLKAWGHRLHNNKGEIENNDWSTWSKEMQEYCRQDVNLTVDLFKHLDSAGWSDESIALEHQAAELCRRIGDAGWTFDMEKATTLYGNLSHIRSKIDVELQDLFEPWEVSETFIPKRDNKTRGYVKDEPFEKKKMIEFNPNSRRHIEFCLTKKYGWKPKLLTQHGHAQIDETVLGSLPYPEAQLLSKMFLIQKRIGQLAEGKNAWMKLVNADGRIRHRIISSGTVSGRASHQRPNLAQVPRASQAFGKECRELFTVPEGYSLVGCDLSGIELRMLAHYLNDDGEYAKLILDGDIHTANQKAAGLETRDQAKTFIYALCYGAGPSRIGEIVGKGAKEGAMLRKRFFATMPAFEELQKGCEEAAARGFLKSLDGRKVPIRSAHSALNTLLQSAAGCISKKWICMIDDHLRAEGYDKHAYMLAWVHDEVQVAVREGYETNVGDRLRRVAAQAGSHFKTRIKIDAEYSIGRTWAGSH